MSTLRDLIESFVFSLGDPRKPAEIILRKVGREIFPPKEADDIYIDALYQAIKDETGAAKLVFSKEELRKWLNVDLGEIDIAPEGEFFKKISKALKDNIPLIPERALTDEDYEQIARNAVRRARGVFFDALSSEKNSAVFNKIVLQRVRGWVSKSKMCWKKCSRDFQSWATDWMRYERVKPRWRSGWQRSWPRCRR